MYLLLVSLYQAPAWATEVVWMQPPTADQQRWVAEQAGATSPPLEFRDLRSAAEHISERDQDAYTALDATLTESRAYETELDGEIVIMQDLSIPLSRLDIVRDENDLERIFRALTYQGFAVDRFFGPDLGQDPKAADYRIRLEGRDLPKSWADAAALFPGREISAYEIAESAQRVAYEEVRSTVARQLPASLIVQGLPDEASLVIDGRAIQSSDSGLLRVPAGQHWVHAVFAERVIERWVVRVGPGEQATLESSLPDSEWRGFVAGLSEAPAVPPGLIRDLDALGGEVWVATPGPRRPTVWALSPQGVRPVDLQVQRSTTSEQVSSGLEVGITAGTGWFNSGDFYSQTRGAAPYQASTFNAASLNLAVEAGRELGPAMAFVGVQAQFTIGAHAFALSGQTQTRIRPQPYLAIGHPWAQVTVGYLLPYHPTVGGRVRLPLIEGLELELAGFYGARQTLTRSDGSTYKTWHLGSVSTGARFTF